MLLNFKYTGLAVALRCRGQVYETSARAFRQKPPVTEASELDHCPLRVKSVASPTSADYTYDPRASIPALVPIDIPDIELVDLFAETGEAGLMRILGVILAKAASSRRSLTR